jgi:hypothetical protein
MTAPFSIDPADFLHEHLTQASADLMRQMLTTSLHAVAVGVENHWMHVDSERSGAEFQSCRKPIGFSGVTTGLQPAQDVIDRCFIHKKIKVSVRPGLVTDQRIHRPSSIDLVDDRVPLKPVNDGMNLDCSHALSAQFGLSIVLWSQSDMPC